MSTASVLNKISNALFAGNFILSKAALMYPAPISIALNILGLFCNLVAYYLWIIRTFLEPDQPRKEGYWYSFMQMQEQFRLSALINTFATLVGFAILWLPAMILPAIWLFLIGNLLWAIGEFHKFKNPPTQDVDYSPERQQASLAFAVVLCTMTLFSAITTTLCFFLPAITLPILLCSGFMTVGLVVLAAYYWFKTRPTETADASAGSYNTMTSSMEPNQTKAEEPTAELQEEKTTTPLQATSFFPRPTKTREEDTERCTLGETCLTSFPG